MQKRTEILQTILLAQKVGGYIIPPLGIYASVEQPILHVVYGWI